MPSFNSQTCVQGLNVQKNKFNLHSYLMSKLNPSNKVRESDENDEDEEDSKEITLPRQTNPLKLHKDDLIRLEKPTTKLEIAYLKEIERKDKHISRLTREISKLKAFISKRKQTYKRKRKDELAPTRALSAYNIFVQDRFSKLARDNEEALKSADVDAQLKRVPPASLVATTGNEWKELPAEEKKFYQEKAAADKKRYQTQMAEYQPPEKQKNKKRNKTGYNMFFSAHVLKLKQSDTGVPSERGSVARIVGNAWKILSPEDKQGYEREAQRQNLVNSESLDEEDSKGLIPKHHNHRGTIPGELDAHEDRTGTREGSLPHHGSAIMHQMMQGQALHHGPSPHISPQLGMAGHNYPPNQHHINHPGQAFHPHHQNGAYHPMPHGHRGQPSHYPPHSSYHPGSML